VAVRLVRPVGHEPTGIYEFSAEVHRRKAALYRKGRDPFSVNKHSRAPADHVETIRALLTQRGEYPLEIVRSSYLPRLNSLPFQVRTLTDIPF
jgi:hypothetical protein